MMMKHYMIALLALASSAAAVAQHGHRHIHERRPSPAVVTQTVTVPVDVYEYNGQSLSEDEVCEGIVNGSLHWAANSMAPPDCQSYVATMSAGKHQSPASVPLSSSLTTQASSSSSLVATSSPAPPASSSAELSPSPSKVAGPSSPTASQSSSPTGGSFISTNPNVDVEFPDGELDCSTFPSQYGPVEVSWVGHNGWTGVQYAQFAENAVSGLSTGISGNECTDSEDGSTTFCSYACPAGYQKSQWPSVQGAAGMAVSVGGLRCEGGKLWLTNPDLSSNLCIPGTNKSFVANKLSDNAAICRTDYPGTEDETVPLFTETGSIYPLTCPDTSTYYQHLGAQTSAEYYVNNKGVPVEQACQWNQDGSNEGNWAPVVIGAETDSSGATWLSIMTSRQNDPTNYQELDFSIELEGDFGGAACFYTQSGGVGYYCSSGALADFTADQSTCKKFDPNNGVTVPGCTVQLFSGTATYHLVETSEGQ